MSNPKDFKEAIEDCCKEDWWGGILARWGQRASQLKEKELASVLSSAHRAMGFLDTMAVAANTKTSSFDPADLTKRKTTVFLVLSPDHMRAQPALMRMWIGTLMRAVVKGGLQEKNKVHFILDEAAALGKMQMLNDAVDKFRGYGIRLLFLYQSMGQLKESWDEGGDQTLLSNTTQVFFGVNDLPTAEYVSNRLGEFTQVVTSGGTSTSTSHQGMGENRSQSYTYGANSGWQQAARKLLQPSEVMQLDPRVAITFTPGMPPIATYLTRYFEEDYSQPKRGIGPIKAFIDAAALLKPS